MSGPERDRTVLVAGELWESALVARTRHSLHLAGVDSKAYAFVFGREPRPLGYGAVVERLLESRAEDDILLLPAGMVVDAGFREALERAARHLPVRQSGETKERVTSSTRVPWLIRASEDMSSPATFFSVGSELLQHIHDIPVIRQDPVEELPRTYARGRPFRRLIGADLYQACDTLQQQQSLEDRPRLLSVRDLENADAGWVYRYNNEPLELDLREAKACDALVAVGAGIKPWHIANQLSDELKLLVIVDSHLPQLGFAFKARAGLETAASWSALCERLPYRSIDDSHLRASHDALFASIQSQQRHWKFGVEYVCADVVSQTYGIIEHLKKSGVQRPVFWYSNIFQPYLGPGISEHLAGVEFSFVSLVCSAFPGAVLLNAGASPVTDPRTMSSSPRFAFRARRFLDQFWRSASTASFD